MEFTCGLTGTTVVIGKNTEDVEIAIGKIGICDLWDKELGYSEAQQLQMGWAEECRVVMQWCKDNNFHYYGASKEDFFEWEGIQEAIDKGCVGVVLENMS